MKLVQIIQFTGTVECISGLCIGTSSDTLEIGGVHQEVIKNPLTKEPYIPGSSLKGKMRSELEKKYGSTKMIWDKKTHTASYKDELRLPCGCGKESCLTCVVFGAHKNTRAKSAPPRMIVRDAPLSKESRAMLEHFTADHKSYLEHKTENIIFRDTNIVDAPRKIERVAAGLSFDFEIILRIFEGDDAAKLTAYVEEGLQLVELSYLGGNGSRGSGHVKFHYDIQYRELNHAKPAP